MRSCNYVKQWQCLVTNYRNEYFVSTDYRPMWSLSIHSGGQYWSLSIHSGGQYWSLSIPGLDTGRLESILPILPSIFFIFYLTIGVDPILGSFVL